MNHWLLFVPVTLLLCQCESVPGPDVPRSALTDSGLSPAERVRAAQNKPLSSDPTDPLNKVRAADGAVGVRVLEF